ncbi:MATE family efflux transporter [Aliiroseovarius zhejiangensis]|uniref:Multidrug-efflux transporter n=1 Tax=Aliiroseovarius zhejiangensis TaxID=1632025 RepID=A0ABQ3INY7_9RHOB|nr:MATE family efflux transporter [Aliiroseovarius zhejiangensis]GHE87370.1 MATE family efflux transporter [Aliiroseovarius zhejiangensis]
MLQTLTLSQHFRAVLVLGLPLVASHLAQFAVQIIDTIMLGWYGVEELAAVTLAGTFFFMFLIMGSGPAWALMPMVAEASEARDDVRVRRLTRMSMWFSVGFALLVLPLMWMSAPILRAIGQDPDLSLLAQDYLRIAGVGLVPALLVMALKSYLAALEHTRIVLWATVLAAVMNGFINYALIFGNWGAPELGVRGAAIASVLIQIASGLVLVVYAARLNAEASLFRRLWKPDWEALRQLLRLGIPIGLTTLAEVGMFSASTVVVGLIGTLELAAHGIALQITAAFFMVHLGLSNTATVRAGRALGRRDEASLRRGALAVTLASVVFGGLTVILFLGAPEPMIKLFLNPSEVRRDEIVTLGSVLLIVAALFQFADGAQAIAMGLLRGVQDTRVPMIIATLSYWGVGMTMSYVLGITLGFGAPGVWVGLLLGLVCAGIFMSWRFWKSSSRIGEMQPGPAV